MMDVNITSADTHTDQDGKATCDFSINVSDLDQFNRVIAAVKKFPAALFPSEDYCIPEVMKF